MFCKSILNEYAVKMNLEKPTYQTVQSAALLPVFKSTAVFNGIHYRGETGKNKKEAEQLAARAAVMSILGQLPFSYLIFNCLLVTQSVNFSSLILQKPVLEL